MKTKWIYIYLVITYSFIGCDNEKRNYLDRTNPFIYKIGDTLIYKGDSTCNTFTVKDITDSYTEIDKNNFEYLDIKVSEISKNCDPYCWGFSIYRGGGSNYTTIEFRNMVSIVSNVTKFIESYQIGTTTLKNVYYVDYHSDTTYVGNNKKNILAYYYTQKNGIIAYVISTGERIELEEKYIRQ